jgi:hypothetical protein
VRDRELPARRVEDERRRATEQIVKDAENTLIEHLRLPAGATPEGVIVARPELNSARLVG